MIEARQPALLILNQMAGPMTWELAEDLGKSLGCVALLTGHSDTLKKANERVLLYRAASYQRGTFFRRAFSWLHYWVQALIWLWHWPAQTPLLLFSNPPMLCWLGYIAQRLRGQTYAVMVHDIYPDILVRLAGFSEKHPLIILWRRLNRTAYERAGAVMTLGEYMAATLEKQFDSRKTKAGKVTVAYPWVDTERIKPIPKEENWFARKYGQVGKITVMYSGNMGVAHDIETMAEAAKQLRATPEIHFMFIGAGPKWHLVERMIEQARLTNVTLLPWQPEEVLPYSLATADIALVSLEQGMQGLAVPSKAFYLMAAGAALICTNRLLNDLQHVITEHRCGGTVKAGDADTLAETILAWHLNRSRLAFFCETARSISVSKFSRKVASTMFLDCLTVF